MNLDDTAALDTNVLLLWLVAGTDTSLLRNFKRVDMFDAKDIPLLREVLQPFSKLVTTPHVLTETSNFVKQAPSYRRDDLLEALRQFIGAHAEHYEEARSLSARAEFMWLGLLDTGLSSLSTRLTVITTDSPLTTRIESLGGSVINFNRVRGPRLSPNARTS